MADQDNGPKKIKRRRGNTLEHWEVALVKAMIARGGAFTNDQDILAYFTRPTRTVNHRLIGEIRTEAKHKATKPATDNDLDAFLSTWPDIDHATGLSIRGDELLIKAREAMIAGVQTFNSAGLTFRAELFIVTAIIAWTYLLHAWFRREGIDYRYAGQKTKEGAEKFWELGHCLKQPKCPVKGGATRNLEFLIEIRQEIEHRSTNRIDDALGAKLQSCALNFNEVLKKEFRVQYGLEKRLPLALQFVSFGAEQRAELGQRRLAADRRVQFLRPEAVGMGRVHHVAGNPRAGRRTDAHNFQDAALALGPETGDRQASQPHGPALIPASACMSCGFRGPEVKLVSRGL